MRDLHIIICNLIYKIQVIRCLLIRQSVSVWSESLPARIHTREENAPYQDGQKGTLTKKLTNAVFCGDMRHQRAIYVAETSGELGPSVCALTQQLPNSRRNSSGSLAFARLVSRASIRPGWA